MGRSIHDALKQFESQGGGGDRNGFFTLKEDKEAAVVRFLHEGEEDLDWYVVHEVEIGGKKRWVQCTESGDCPLCQGGNKALLKVFLQLVDKRDGKTKTWERGQTFIPKVLGLMNKYGALCNRPYEIERHGKPRDTGTKYEVYPLDKDEKKLADLPKRQNLLGDLIIKDETDEVTDQTGDGRVRKGGFILVLSQENMRKAIEGQYRLNYPDNNGSGGRGEGGGRPAGPEETPPRRRESAAGSGGDTDVF